MPAPFSPGLEGVVAAQTEISEVDGQNGRLIYRGGYLTRELAERSFEEAAYLLWHAELPQPGQLEELKRQLAANRNLNEQARAALKGLHPDVDPMDALRTVLSAQGAAPEGGCRGARGPPRRGGRLLPASEGRAAGGAEPRARPRRQLPLHDDGE